MMSSSGFVLGGQQPLLLSDGAVSPAWSSVSSGSLNGDIVGATPLQQPASSYYSPDACLSSRDSDMLLDCAAAQEWLNVSCSEAVAAVGVSSEIMFPGLAQLPVTTSTVSPALSLVDEVVAAHHASPPNIFGSSSLATTVAAANDAAAFDGWLQQYVNADAIEGVAAAAAAVQAAQTSGDRHPRALSMDSAYRFTGASVASICPDASLLSGLPTDSSLSAHSPPLAAAAGCSGIDLLNDSDVAAIASAAAGALSSDVLASMISSAANFCSPRGNSSSSASELSMLAALPFTAIPMANIAPQKTLAISSAAAEPAVPPPAKKQRRPSPPAQSSLARKAMPARQVAENGRGDLPARSAGSSKGVAPTAVATASASHGRRPQSSGSSSSSSSSESSASPPPAATRNMVPLAPRQAASPSDGAVKRGESAKKEGSVASGERSPSSGTNTPPGLSVLAKIAQKQAPIQVKLEDPQPIQQTTNSLRPIAQACSPNHRMNSASHSAAANDTTAAALDKGDCSVLLAAATAVAATGETVAQKRQERLIKNRAAALLSRKRKRDYMTKLESEVEELRESNMSLAKRLEEMEQRMNVLAAERDELRRVNGSANIVSASSAA
ncbi:hypothetical protein GGI21_004229, partial [Coemansia aciculifera]